MTPCQTPGCSRRAPKGWANCTDHTRRILREAFAPEPRAWHERARANSLPTVIVGGIAA